MFLSLRECPWYLTSRLWNVPGSRTFRSLECYLFCKTPVSWLFLLLEPLFPECSWPLTPEFCNISGTFLALDPSCLRNGPGPWTLDSGMFLVLEPSCFWNVCSSRTVLLLESDGLNRKHFYQLTETTRYRVCWINIRFYMHLHLYS